MDNNYDVNNEKQDLNDFDQYNEETKDPNSEIFNKEKVEFAQSSNYPSKSLTRSLKPSIFTRGYGPGSKGFTTMAGLGTLLAIISIVLLYLKNKM